MNCSFLFSSPKHNFELYELRSISRLFQPTKYQLMSFRILDGSRVQHASRPFCTKELSISPLSYTLRVNLHLYDMYIGIPITSSRNIIPRDQVSNDHLCVFGILMVLPFCFWVIILRSSGEQYSGVVSLIESLRLENRKLVPKSITFIYSSSYFSKLKDIRTFSDLRSECTTPLWLKISSVFNNYFAKRLNYLQSSFSRIRVYSLCYTISQILSPPWKPPKISEIALSAGLPFLMSSKIIHRSLVSSICSMYLQIELMSSSY